MNSASLCDYRKEKKYCVVHVARVVSLKPPRAVIDFVLTRSLYPSVCLQVCEQP